MRRPGRQLLALASEAVHLARDLSERVLDRVTVARAMDRLPVAAGAPYAPALDLDDHHTEVGVGDHEVGLAIGRLVARALLEPGDVTVYRPRRPERMVYPDARRSSPAGTDLSVE